VLKVYDKPVRKEPRYFTSCDAARIARQVTFDHPDETPEQVLACIAKGMGFAYISLSRTTVVESGIGFGKPKIPKVILEKAATNFEKLLEKLPGGIKRWGAALPIFKKLLDAIKPDIAEPPQALVDDVIQPGKCRCKYSAGEEKHGYKIKP